MSTKSIIIIAVVVLALATAAFFIGKKQGIRKAA